MVKRNRKSTAGFSLLEFLAVMVLVAVLALIAVPIYDSYTNKARFQDVIQAANSFKPAVSACIQSQQTTTGCNGGALGVPAPTAADYKYVSNLVITNGAITATSANIGATNKQYILTPTYTKGQNAVKWAVTGDCLTAGLCDNPT